MPLFFSKKILAESFPNLMVFWLIQDIFIYIWA